VRRATTAIADPPTAPVARRAARPAGRPVDVFVAMRSAARPVRRDFLGLSFEVGNLRLISSNAARGGLVTLLRTIGPGTMRFGGISADVQAAWVQGGSRPPAWASRRIAAADLARLALLARATGWRVLLTVNLGHYDPRAAAQEARAAKSALGASLAGIEIGNEPDAYVSKGLRPPGWSFAAYRPQAAAYRTAIRAAAPGVPIAGPDASSGARVLPWVSAAGATLRPALLTDHYYPSSSCGYRPSLSDLLSPLTRGAETAMLARLAAIAGAAGRSLRVDETNNISCGGQAGVSDSFAAALWAADYGVRAMAAGLDGVNFHDLVEQPRSYAPLVLVNKRFRANPEWYALLLLSRLVGDRPLQTRAGAGLVARGFATPAGGLRIVLVDFEPPGSGALLVRLRVPGRLRAGPIERLTGPSPAATAGVRLAGRRVSSSGGWRPASPLPRVYGGPGNLSLSIEPDSAALVTLQK
jgi:hypothetical protein